MPKTELIKAKKKYGQNFLKDQQIVEKIAEVAELDQDVAVLEIGPGLGALTKELVKRAGFVLAYEIDESLIPMLKENLEGYQNYKVIHQDILKADVKQDIQDNLKNYKTIYVVANLPYYITTPIIMGLLSSGIPIKKYVVMMQLEVADRICGKPKTKDYNALSVMVAYKAAAKKVLFVPRQAFIPAPHVDSAVVELAVYEQLPYSVLDEQQFYHLLRIAFTQRRKTLYNNLSLEYDKEYIYNMLEKLGFQRAVRAEELSLTDFILMSDYITQN